MDYIVIIITVVLCAVSTWIFISDECNYTDKKLGRGASKNDSILVNNPGKDIEDNNHVSDEKNECTEDKIPENATQEDTNNDVKISIKEAESSIIRWVLIYSAIMVVLTITSSVVMYTVYKDNSIWTSVKCMSLLSVMWPLAFIDYKTYRIPNKFIIYGLICRVVILAFELIFNTEAIMYVIVPEIIASGALLLAAILCRVCMKGSIGVGDIKLFMLMGLFLGMQGIWSAIFSSLVVSFVMSIYLLATKKKTKKDVIPFGPAIVIGTYLSILLSGV